MAVIGDEEVLWLQVAVGNALFVGRGQAACDLLRIVDGLARTECAVAQAVAQSHSPRQFRVNGVVQNMTEFGQAFGCKTGQPMMPANACQSGEELRSSLGMTDSNGSEGAPLPAGGVW